MIDIGLSKPLIYLITIVVIVLALWGWDHYRYNQGYNLGVNQERDKWIAAQNELQRQMDEERRAAEKEIARIEREYIEKSRSFTEQIDDLEKVISELKEEDEKEEINPNTNSRILFNKRLSDAINSIGRTAP